MYCRKNDSGINYSVLSSQKLKDRENNPLYGILICVCLYVYAHVCTHVCVDVHVCVILECLQVKCCLHESVDLRSRGCFILYNYARIATIMDKFEDGVKKGTPKLHKDLIHHTAGTL